MESVSNLWKILFEYNTIDYQVDMSVSQMSDTDRKWKGELFFIVLLNIFVGGCTCKLLEGTEKRSF